MTTQTELDADLLAVLEQHLTTRREFLKEIRDRLMKLPYCIDRDPYGDLPDIRMVSREEVRAVLNRLIDEAKLPGSE